MIPIVYASTTGNTEHVALRVMAMWPGDESIELVPLEALNQSLIDQSHALIFGISTWNFGELQDDWEEFWGDFCDLSFDNKKVAVFGLGDQLGYGDWFVDAMGILADQLLKLGATLYGEWPCEGYAFEASKAFNRSSNTFIGLALDEDSQSYETDARIESWVKTLALSFEDIS